VGPRAGLDADVTRKIPSSYRDSNPRSSSLQPSAIHRVIPPLLDLKIMHYSVLDLIKYTHDQSNILDNNHILQ